MFGGGGGFVKGAFTLKAFKRRHVVDVVKMGDELIDGILLEEAHAASEGGLRGASWVFFNQGAETARKRGGHRRRRLGLSFLCGNRFILNFLVYIEGLATTVFGDNSNSMSFCNILSSSMILTETSSTYLQRVESNLPSIWRFDCSTCI